MEKKSTKALQRKKGRSRKLTAAEKNRLFWRGVTKARAYPYSQKEIAQRQRLEKARVAHILKKFKGGILAEEFLNFGHLGSDRFFERIVL